MSRINKIQRTQDAMATAELQQAFDQSLQFSRKRFKKFEEIIVALYVGRDLSQFSADNRISKIDDCFKKLPVEKQGVRRAAFMNALVYVNRWSVLTSGADYIEVVYKAVLHKQSWVNDLFQWRPTPRRAYDQVTEFVQHLFCRYEVPRFLYKAFLPNSGKDYSQWFIHIGAGRKPKDLSDLPEGFTQKMVHYFLQAPEQLTICEALRWAQVRGLGGDKELADRITHSWIGSRIYEATHFWESFILITINGGMIDYDTIGQLIDYVRHTKNYDNSYSLKGRTLRSLLRQCEDWHGRTINIRGLRNWGSCGIGELIVERKTETVSITELCGSILLQQEGQTMRHCVASYAHQCERKAAAIFSLKKYVQGEWLETLATIEVNLMSKRVVQAKAKMNRPVNDEAKKYIDVWAKKEGLALSPYLW